LAAAAALISLIVHALARKRLSSIGAHEEEEPYCYIQPLSLCYHALTNNKQLPI